MVTLAGVLLGVSVASGRVPVASGRVPVPVASRPPVSSPAGVSAAASGAAPSTRELVGQRFVVAMRGTTPSSRLLARIRAGEIGGVILFGANIVDATQVRRSITTMQNAARAAGRPPLLVATDQEGGRVRRLPWVGPREETSTLGLDGRARIQAVGRSVGRGLRTVGVNVDLAPVADVPGSGSFMALEERTFAATPAAVRAASTAFAQGLAAAHVAATAKHFPGIGRAVRNTDRTAVSIGASAGGIDRVDLSPFRGLVAAGVPIVMVSNATYPALDSKPAPWSSRLQAILRRDLGFSGVTITDSLESAARTRGRTVPAVATLAAQAGVDLLLVTGDETASEAAFEHVVAAAERGRLSRQALRTSYARIVGLKRVYG